MGASLDECRFDSTVCDSKVRNHTESVMRRIREVISSELSGLKQRSIASWSSLGSSFTRPANDVSSHRVLGHPIRTSCDTGLVESIWHLE